MVNLAHTELNTQGAAQFSIDSWGNSYQLKSYSLWTIKSLPHMVLEILDNTYSRLALPFSFQLYLERHKNWRQSAALEINVMLREIASRHLHHLPLGHMHTLHCLIEDTCLLFSRTAFLLDAFYCTLDAPTWKTGIPGGQITKCWKYLLEKWR